MQACVASHNKGLEAAYSKDVCSTHFLAPRAGGDSHAGAVGRASNLGLVLRHHLPEQPACAVCTQLCFREARALHHGTCFFVPGTQSISESASVLQPRVACVFSGRKSVTVAWHLMPTQSRFHPQSSPSIANPGFLRQLSILLLNPLLEDVEFHRLVATTCGMLVRGNSQDSTDPLAVLFLYAGCKLHRGLLPAVHVACCLRGPLRTTYAFCAFNYAYFSFIYFYFQTLWPLCRLIWMLTSGRLSCTCLRPSRPLRCTGGSCI